MKDGFCFLFFAMGMVSGMLLYKHSQDAKTIVKKAENAVVDATEDLTEKVEKKVKDIKKEVSK